MIYAAVATSGFLEQKRNPIKIPDNHTGLYRTLPGVCLGVYDHAKRVEIKAYPPMSRHIFRGTTKQHHGWQQVEGLDIGGLDIGTTIYVYTWNLHAQD